MPEFIYHFFHTFFPDFHRSPDARNKPMHFLNHHDAKITYGGKKVEIFVELSTSAWKKPWFDCRQGKKDVAPAEMHPH